MYTHTHIYPFLDPKPAVLRDPGYCGCAGMWPLLARVWLCEDL